MPAFADRFARGFGGFAYAASLITLYRLFLFLNPLHELPVASNQQSLWRMALVSLLFVIQHSLMATPSWKNFWCGRCFGQMTLTTGQVLQFVCCCPAERIRSVFMYAMISSVCYLTSLAVLLEILMHFWLASPTTVWNLDSPAVINASRYVYLFSWALVGYQLLTLDHFEMLGITQTVGPIRLPMKTFTRFERAQLRHPIFVPVIVLLFAVPHMTFDRLLIALGTAAYLLARNDVKPDDYNRAL